MITTKEVCLEWRPGAFSYKPRLNESRSHQNSELRAFTMMPQVIWLKFILRYLEIFEKMSCGFTVKVRSEPKYSNNGKHSLTRDRSGPINSNKRKHSLTQDRSEPLNSNK
uniref:Uncharacterized protein n=1 Tax=Cacopsylla melanoneura TaxID=428564 RepID=A0A8D8X4N1_9HEMI